MADKLPFNGPVELNGATTITGATTVSGDMTVTGIQSHTNASGKYVNGLNFVTKKVDVTTGAGNGQKVLSGAIHIPAKSVIREVSVQVHTGLAYDSPGNAGAVTLGIKAGTAAEGAQIVSLDADSLATAGTSVAAGTGTSTIDGVHTLLGGNARLAFVGSKAIYFDAAGEVHVTLLASESDNAYTAGAVTFTVEFATLGGNA
tara:strand:- start:1812 stop:2417 length:606 start_codon:yes stop_codon:yes gene_type:complete